MIELPFITIVMPVRNEARFIRETLSALLNQDYPEERFEIIVVDGMSDDGTEGIVNELRLKYRQVHFLKNPRQRSSAGRNIGFCNGCGEYFLVVDGHCFIPDRSLLKNIAVCFSESGADCLGRPQPLDPPGITDFQRAVALARSSWIGHGGDSLIYGQFEGYASPVSNGAAYRREVFKRVGYVDENFDAVEDVEFNYRVEQAGLKAYTSPKLTIRYYPRDSLKGLFRQMVRYGTGRRRFTKKHPQARTFNQLIPAAFAGGLCFLPFISLYSIFTGHLALMIVLTMLYILYAVMIIIESIRIGLRAGIKYLPVLPLIFFTVHFGLGWGFLKETTADIFSIVPSEQGMC